ncbi:MAG TPA: tetratricopeptide repeat protein [Verrucomicrobiota bacterium]|nr:tetratricopeptide repeat protein [Verrucomicrobiota bacterium]HQL78811.1 tetratricopeptide repeat protein [Verrucomicrobiota bacterium]
MAARRSPLKAAKRNLQGSRAVEIDRRESGGSPPRGFGSSQVSGRRLGFFRERSTLLIGALLLLLVVWVFLPSLRNGFVNLDDNVYVYENSRVLQGLTLENLRWAFSNLAAGFWHPLTWLTLMLDCQLFGLRPAGHHFTSLLLHAANTILLFLAFQRLTGATWRSAVVAALFALHPLHVEPVAWASGRKDVLCALFWMLTMLSYARYVEETRGGSQKPKVGNQRSVFHLRSALFYLLSLLCFVCGLMSKTMIVTLPLVLLLLDWWPLRRFQPSACNPRRSILFLEKAPFLGAALVGGLLTLYAEKGVGALPTASDVPIYSRLANAVLSYPGYLGQTFWPDHLAVYYPFPRAFPAGTVLAAALLGLAITAGALWAARARPHLAFGWIWYSVTLLPVIGIIQVGGHAHADRYTYVPLIGVFVVLVWGAHELTARWRSQRLLLSLAGGAVILLCAVLARQQIGCWKDSETLFRHALAVTQDNELAHNNLGTALARQGRAEEAVIHLQEALRLVPDYPGIHNNLGAALARQGRLDEAIPHLREAVRLAPGDAGAHCNLADALTWQGRLDEAIAEYQAAIKLNPNEAATHCNLGNALAGKGLLDDAIASYRQALKLNPAFIDAHNRLGTVLGLRGRLEEAIGQFHEALKLYPESAEALCGLGIALVRQNRLEDAITRLRAALDRNPNYAEAHCNLGVALAAKGRLEEAVFHLREALRLRPDYADAQNNLRAALDLKSSTAAPPSALPSP